MSSATAPAIYPPGWTRERMMRPDGTVVGSMLTRRYPSGLRAIFSIDRLAPDYPDLPLERPGTYAHLSISRADRYPGWDEMRDLIRSCGLFERTRSVFMALPPDDRYINIHNNCFHWWQEAVTV